jgi:6-pyruvoyltetrahydropterin/6-carboxytetrahydropterin synthase
MIITVVKEFTFDAAHYLPDYPGKCSNTHGHTYRLQVGFRGPIDRYTGMVLDFGEIKEIVNTLITDKLDHRYLNLVNEQEPIILDFPYLVPSAENMVKWIVGKLKEYISKWEDLAELVFVRLYETPTSYAEWRA